MATLDDVARLVEDLPDTTEAERHGTRTWWVRNKAFAWERGFGKADLRRFGDETPPAGPILAVRVEDLGEKEAVLASNPDAFFTIPHFDGFPAILLQLSKVSMAALADVLLDAWRADAPPALVRAREQGRSTASVVIEDGAPITVFASGGDGPGQPIEEIRKRADGVDGSHVFFEYESIEPWLVPGKKSLSKRPRREADRDADELRAVADIHGAARAVGFSRGARAILGALAEEPGRFERIALVLPPGGTAAGEYWSWLASLSGGAADSDGGGREEWLSTDTDILVVGQRGDRGHPLRVAEDWADRLGARLEVFDSGALFTDHRERLRDVLAAFMNA